MLIPKQCHYTTGYPFGYPPGNLTDTTKSSVLFQVALSGLVRLQGHFICNAGWLFSADIYHLTRQSSGVVSNDYVSPNFANKQLVITVCNLVKSDRRFMQYKGK